MDKIRKTTKLIQYSNWSWEKGRDDWWCGYIDDNIDEIEHLKNIDLRDYELYAEDSFWRYYRREGEPLDMAFKIRVKKLECPNCRIKI